MTLIGSNVWAECPSATPEDTLECYFNAVDSKNESDIADVYLDLRKYHFNVLIPAKREIHKKVTLAKNIATPLPSGEIPVWGQKGNKEIWVREIYKDNAQMVSFWLKHINGKWFIAGHSAHGQPE